MTIKLVIELIINPSQIKKSLAIAKLFNYYEYGKIDEDQDQITTFQPSRFLSLESKFAPILISFLGSAA